MSNFKVLMVCLGNICRSPLAEGIFAHKVGERSLEEQIAVDSCGTGSWHIGNPPHIESQKIAKKNGIDISSQSARQLRKQDGKEFHLLVAMDSTNKKDIISLCGDSASVVCLREYDSERDSLDVPDPYYGGPDGFIEVFNIIDRSCEALLRDIQNTYLKQ